MNTKLCTVESKWQADKIVNDLQTEGIESTAIFRPREYSAIIAGTSDEMYDIFVSADNYEASLGIIQSDIDQTSESKVDEDQKSAVSNKSEEQKLFKRVVLFSILCVIFPVVFLVIAWVNYQNYSKIAEDHGKLFLAMISLLFGLLVSLFYLYMYIAG